MDCRAQLVGFFSGLTQDLLPLESDVGWGRNIQDGATHISLSHPGFLRVTERLDWRDAEIGGSSLSYSLRVLPLQAVPRSLSCRTYVVTEGSPAAAKSLSRVQLCVTP